MRMIVSFWVIVSQLTLNAQQIYRVTESQVDFRSDAPMELIEASCTEMVGLIDIAKMTYAFRLPIATFEGFNSPLQREHFNENYLETDRYPYAEFTGKIDGDFDLSKPGVYDVFATGTLKIHGIEKGRAIQSKITVKENGVMRISSSFIIPLKDHRIKIPTIVRYKIAEVINVSMEATLTER